MVKKKNETKNYTETVMVKVSDDWYPCYDGNLVMVSAMILLDGLTVRVCAWGNDDFGMEKDVRASSGGEARELYRKSVKYIHNLKELEPIDQEFLRSEGFGPA